MQKEKKLSGITLAVFESRHSKTMGDLVAAQGGTAMLAPSMKEIPLDSNLAVFDFADALFSKKIDVLILLTGVGTRALGDVVESRYAREEFYKALKRIQIIPRGPKPIRVLNEWKIPYTLTVPEPNTWVELIETLDENSQKVPLLGKRVAVQEYGVSNPDFLEQLERRGAYVMRVPVYRWALPDDLGPMERAIDGIIGGQVQVAVFTTAVQIEHAFQVAEKMGKSEVFKNAINRIVVASVGPDCSAAIRQKDVRVDIEPESPKMGPLVLDIAEKAPELLQNTGSGYSRAAEVKQAVFEIIRSSDVQESVFMKACRKEKTPYTPIWIMRQAGRYMKSYRDLREKHGFKDLCKIPDLACEVTVGAQEALGVDAAILFSDILLLLEPMGLGLDYEKGSGPVISGPVTNSADVSRLNVSNISKSLSYVYDAVRLIRRRLHPGVPLIGFAGAPFTLASYMIEGGSSREFRKTKEFMKSDWDRWNVLMKKISDATTEHLNEQIRAGAQAVQLFDSWAGALTPEEYRMYSMPFSRSVFQRLDKSAVSIHFGTDTKHFLDAFSEAGGDVIGVDHTIRIGQAVHLVRKDQAIQGNLDPLSVMDGGARMELDVVEILRQMHYHDGHIFNLGHGILPKTPEENAVQLVKLVHELSAKQKREL